MSQVQTHPAPANVHRTGTLIRTAAIVVIVATALAASLLIVRGPTFVRRVTVENATSLKLDVDTAAAQPDGWVPAGVAFERGATVFRDVLDHGDRWAFRFTNGGESVVVRVSRDDLVRNGWRMTVPASAVDDLTAR